MMKLLPFVLLVALMPGLSSCAHDADDPEVAAMRRLVNRVVPEYSKHITLERLDRDSVDRFEIESQGRSLVIRGNNANSMAAGLNHYLKYYCLAQYSWFKDDALELPAKMPQVAEKVCLNARVKERFFLNYCTFGYTMPWWNWEQWEHFIDWMALNGINLPLAITGQEAVWYEVWRDYGLTDEEIRNYFTGPAHLPWHRMQNIDRWGGPLPFSWLEHQKELQKKIVARERELGMKPVLPGFAGHVPPTLKRTHPDAPLSPLGEWAGFDSTYQCYFLDPESPLFAEIQQRFIAKETELFGTDHIYGIDIFNEIDPPCWESGYLARISRQVYASLAAADPNAQWLEMTWLFWNKRQHWEVDNRIEAYITSFSKDRHLLLDYYCEHHPVWEHTKAFHGVPYIWCYLGNFGSNAMLTGNLDTVNARIERAFEKGGDNFIGIGSTLEGFDCNPFIYEYVFEKAWDNPLTRDVGAWTERMADRRAGGKDPKVRAAWMLLTDSVYNKVSSPAHISRINKRPTISNAKHISPTYAYSNLTLLHTLDLMLASDSKSRTLHFDIVNITRQLLCNHFDDLYTDYMAAYHNRNLTLMRQTQQRMQSILDDIDSLLATEQTFLLGRWIRDARALGSSEAEKDYYECNARNIITTWGPPNTHLNDYSARTWAGLIASYYTPRWNIFFHETERALLANQAFDTATYHRTISRFEQQWWQNLPGTFSTQPHTYSIDLARQIVQKYRTEIEMTDKIK